MAGLIRLCAAPAFAQDYFVDFDHGNDAWSGKAPQAVTVDDGPWKTLRKASLAKLLPGDTLALRCDAVWHEPLTLIRSGTAAQPIVVRAYGTNCAAAPMIDAAIPVDGWQLRPDGNLAAAIDFTPGAVFLNGDYLAPARYPRDSDLLADGMSASGKDFSAIPNGVSSRDLAKATVHLRTGDWIIEERHLDDPAYGRLVLDQPTRFPAGKGARFYLSGKPWMLTYPNAWGFDSQTGTLLLRLPGSGAAPNSAPNVEVARFDYGLHIAGAEHVRVEGLRVSHGRLDGVRVVNSKDVELSGLVVGDSGRDGVAVVSSKNVSVLQSTIERSRQDGLSAVQSKDLTVRDNRIAHSGVIGPPANSLAAINVDQATGVLVEGNMVKDSGYIGIRFHRDARILNNTVEDSCQVLSDCGAIYSWANNDPWPLVSVVSGNHVIGTRADVADNAYRPYNSGIYLDDLSNGVAVKDNDVSHCDSGVHVHNGFNLHIEHNSLSDNRRNQIYFSFGHPTRSGATLTGNLIADNTLTYGPASLGVEIVSRYPDVLHGDFQKNHYVAIGSRAVAYQTEPPGTETRSPGIYALDRWRSQLSQDLDGSFEERTAPAPATAKVQLRKSFRSDPHAWDAWSPDGSGALVQRKACGDGVDACMELRGGKVVVLAMSRPLALSPGMNCAVHVKTRSADNDTPLQIRMRRNQQPFADVGLFTQVLSGQVWSEYLLPFTVNKLARGREQLELKVNAGRTVLVSGAEVECR
ncbi:nitrous oxide reductase family maturation protein NosD [Thiobacillus sp.]|uniref:right-handed parallel beta-helix repeat-containing protein n=1 Tax=Thiobacillus sp. TaxID=924 RepID=UPI001ACCABF7|nr:right-handed parallel beta-helix repeat-containing protein [Thiobacillus sp.]MBN8778001.1 right-handed parallel beta-helix repeat-containing protein [Thiobacillus sp.]